MPLMMVSVGSEELATHPKEARMRPQGESSVEGCDQPIGSSGNFASESVCPPCLMNESSVPNHSVHVKTSTGRPQSAMTRMTDCSVKKWLWYVTTGEGEEEEAGRY